MTQAIKNPPTMQETTGNVVSIPGLGRSPKGGNGNLLQNSCLENPVDGGPWQATMHSLATSWHD